MTGSQAAAVFRRTTFTGRTDLYLPSILPRLSLSQALQEAVEGVAPVDVSGSLMSDPYVKDAVTRIGRYNDYWGFYAGRQHTVEYEGGDRKPVFNYCRRIVDKRASWATAHGFDLIPMCGNESVAPKLMQVWKQNNVNQLLRRTFKANLTCGDSFWYLTVKTKDRAGNVLPKEQWSIRICPLNPSYVFPLWMEDDPLKMRGVMIQFPVWGRAANRIQVFTAVYTATTIEFYRNYDRESVVPNPLGCLPIIHVPSCTASDLPFGISALQDVIPINREYNDLQLRFARIIKYHADPTTLVFGTSLNNMERGANRVWSNLPVEGRVENLELKSDLPTIVTRLGMLKEEMYEAGRTPQISYDAKGTGVSHTSGVAMQLLFAPLVEATIESQEAMTTAIQNANEVIEAMSRVILGNDIGESGADDPLDVEVKWTSLLPRDEMQEMTIIEKKLALGLISKAAAARACSEVADSQRAALELAADRVFAVAEIREKAAALKGSKPNFSYAMLDSFFLPEKLLDVATKLGDLSDDNGKGGDSTEPADTAD